MEKITWAPKIRQAKIWQIYQNDALGAVDEALVEDVGFRLLQRCRCIWLVSHCQVECPRCGSAFVLGDPVGWKMRPGIQTCPTPACGWQTTSHVWHESWAHRDLLGVAAIPAVEIYLQVYPLAHTPETRMVCIDQLIHAFHVSLRTGKAGRSFANNLIEGSHKQVVDLLDRLFAIDNGIDKDRWRSEVDGMFRLRRGKE